MAEKVVIEVEARFDDQVTGKTKPADDAVKQLGDNAKKTQKKLDDMSKKARRVILEGDTKNLVKKLDEADKKLQKLTKGKFSLKLSADDKATAKIKKIVDGAQRFANKAYKAKMIVDDSGALRAISSVVGAGGRFAGKTWRATVGIVDKASGVLSHIKNQLFSIKTLVLAIGTGMAANQLLMKPIGLADAYSGAQIGFSTLLGETQGQQMMDDLDAFAKATPFNTSEVIAQTQKMIAMGWDARDIIDDMRIIGDAAAATGKGSMGLEQITLALAQIQTKGKISAEELNQLAEAGISAKRYLAEGLGFGGDDAGMAKLSKELEKGTIYAEEGLQAIMKGMEEYAGMMDATANETVQGLMAQIKDTFEIGIFRKWGQGLQEGGREGLGEIVKLLNTTEDGVNRVGDMLYDLGATISGFVADRFADSVERINTITDTYEFRMASLPEKMKMLWRGVIADPISAWWDENRSKFADKAGEMGASLGRGLSNGIKAFLGITDIFDESDLSEQGGAGIAQSFAKGFVDNFDVSGIGAKVVEAIGDVWGALPLWAKVLIGGYGGAKIASNLGGMIAGIGGLAGGARTARGLLGTAGTGGSGLLGFGANAAMAMGAGASLSAGSASLLGLGGIAGGVSAVHGLTDLFRAASALHKADYKNAQKYGASGAMTLGGVASGAAIGTMIAPGIGTAIGAGIGGVAGWFGGKKIANDIEAAKVESQEMRDALKDGNNSAEALSQTFEKGVFENMKKNMGDIKLTASEIERLSKQIVWGKDLEAYDKFSQTTKQVQSLAKSINQYGQATDRWLWKAGFGVKFNENEIETIVEDFNGYIESAKSLVESKHYEFTAAVDMLVDTDSASGKSILASGDKFYASVQSKLDGLSNELSGKLNVALEDGVITLNEEQEIANLQRQIAEITQKLSEAETSAKMDLIKLKFSGGTLDYDSFNAFMEQMQVTIDERVKSNDEAFTVALSGLKLQLAEGAITQEQYDAQVEALVAGYRATIDSVKAEVMGVEIDIIAGSGYGAMLGENAKGILQKALTNALENNSDPINWTPDKVRKILGAEQLSEEAATALGRMLSGVFNQLEALDPTVTIDPKLKFLKKLTADDVAQRLGIPKEQAVTIVERISGEKSIENVIKVLGEEFGLKKTDVWTIVWELTGKKKIKNLINVTKDDFGIPNTVTSPINIVLTGNPIFNKGTGTPYAKKARGGIVDGGAQLITVAEEAPEMIIPLSSQRRGRAMKLWAETGHLLDVPGFARGGKTGSRRGDGARIDMSGGANIHGGGGNVTVDMGGVNVSISVEANGNGKSVVDAIKEQGEEIAETVAGILANALETQFANTPT